MFLLLYMYPVPNPVPGPQQVLNKCLVNNAQCSFHLWFPLEASIYKRSRMNDCLNPRKATAISQQARREALQTQKECTTKTSSLPMSEPQLPTPNGSYSSKAKSIDIQDRKVLSKDQLSCFTTDSTLDYFLLCFLKDLV